MKDANELSELLRKSIGHGLPGEKSHLKMLPDSRHLLPISGNASEAAVLILIFPKNGRWHTVFMKRNEYDGPHSGQISFPGGRRDPGDADLKQTALREAQEEIGIESFPVRIIGELSLLHIPVSGFIVKPYLAIANVTPSFSPDRNEAEYVIEAALDELLSPEAIRAKTMKIRGKQVSVPYYDIHGEVIWGATAMMLAEFLDLYSGTISDL